MTEFFGQPIKTWGGLKFWKGKSKGFKNMNDVLVERIEKLETRIRSLEKSAPCVCDHCGKPAIVRYDAVSWEIPLQLTLLLSGKWQSKARVVLHYDCVGRSKQNRRKKDRRAKSTYSPNDRRVANRRRRQKKVTRKPKPK